MANTAQATKRARQSEIRRQHNASLRSMARTTIKKTTKAIQEGNISEAQSAYHRMQQTLDRIATTGLMSANKVARHKSRLAHRLRKFS